jgi:serine/threonine-protein kinase
MPIELRQQLETTLAGSYAIGRELGGGGMSRVFLAEEVALGRRVVVKVLSPGLAGELDVERFAHEIRLAARLQQANIVPVLTAGQVGELPYYTMPFVEGASLRDRIQHGALAVPEAIAVLRDMARALAFAHAKGVVHRDIKPGNVLLSGGAAMVTDFGIATAIEQAVEAPAPDPIDTQARLAQSRVGAHDEGLDQTRALMTLATGQGLLLGTPAYMAPEQAAPDGVVDHRADIYAFGMTAYEMLAGAHPFQGQTPGEFVLAQISETPPPLAERCPHVPAPLSALVGDCLAKNPGARPRSANELLDALDRLTLTAPQGTGAAPVDFDRRPSVAVLPLQNIGGDPDNEYFSDGMTEEILGALAHMSGIRVAARTSCLALKGTKDDVRAIAARLGVRTIVEGSVRKSGDRVRIAVQLTNATDGVTLWAERFDRALTDIFAVQDEIARSIAVTFAGMVTPRPAAVDRQAERGRLRGAGPEHPEAYEQFLRGRAYLEMRDMDMPRAIERFERAIALDPGLAAAHAWLAYSYLSLGYYCAIPSAAAFTRARDLANRALEINPREEVAVTVRGAVSYWFEWDREEGLALTRRAVEIAPGLVECRSQHMYLLMAAGRTEEALAMAAESRALDPLSRVAQIDRAEMLMIAGRYEESLDAFHDVMLRNPENPLANYWAGVIHVRLGRADRALAFASRFASLGRHPHAVGLMACAHAIAGRVDEARALVAELETRRSTEYVAPVLIASVYRWLGEHERLYEWLGRAVDERDWWLGRLHVEPWFVDLRHDPRLQAVIARVGVAPPAHNAQLTTPNSQLPTANSRGESLEPSR